MVPDSPFTRFVLVGKSRLSTAFRRVSPMPIRVFSWGREDPPDIRDGDVIVNTVAYTDVTNAQKRYPRNEQEKAIYVNAILAGRIALWASSFDVPFIHVSTDYVFPGFAGPARRDDTPKPLNFYGWSKLLGEHAVLELHPKAKVCRVGWLWGFEYPLKDPSRLAASLNSDRALYTYANRGNPTLVDCLPSAMLRVAMRDDGWRIHHAGPPEDPVSWAEFCERLFRSKGVDVTIGVKDRTPQTVRDPVTGGLVPPVRRPVRGGLVPNVSTCLYERQFSYVGIDPGFDPKSLKNPLLYLRRHPWICRYDA